MASNYIRFMHSLFLPAGQSAGGVWQPPADIYQTRHGWLVKFDLAGVRPEDVEVLVQDNRLIVRGARHDWTLEEGCCHYQMEIAYSHFERTVTLPVNLEQAQFQMEHRDGMLLVHIHREGVPQ
jgi:HSP20 family protein